MYQRILVPVDGSAGGHGAVNHAVAIAAAMDAMVHFLFVMDTDRARYEGVVNTGEAREALAARGGPILDRATRTALGASVRSERELTEGTPVDVIPQTAAGFDLVVVGSHGEGLW